MKSITSYLLLFICQFILTSCSSTYRVVANTDNNSLPNSDFLFEHLGKIEFFNTNGEFLGEIEVKQNCHNEGECENNEILLHGVTWSRDVHAVIGTIWEQGPNYFTPIMILGDGSILACPGEQRLYTPSRLRLLRDNIVLAVSTSVNMEYSLVEYNMAKCRIESKVFNFVDEGSINEVDISKDNWLAILGSTGIDIYSQIGEKIITIPNAFCGSWSPQGDKIIITKESEIQILDKNGILLQRLPGSNRCPAWSPDGTSILYSDTDGIKIINIQTKEITQLPLSETIPSYDSEGNLDWNWHKD